MFVQGETHGDFEFLKVRREGDVALVSMDRPPVNAVSQSMYLEIRELFSSARSTCLERRSSSWPGKANTSALVTTSMSS